MKTLKRTRTEMCSNGFGMEQRVSDRGQVDRGRGEGIRSVPDARGAQAQRRYQRYRYMSIKDEREVSEYKYYSVQDVRIHAWRNIYDQRNEEGGIQTTKRTGVSKHQLVSTTIDAREHDELPV